MIPSEVVHYHRPGRPFANLSDLDEGMLLRVLESLAAERTRGEHRRVFGRRYMELRRRTEARLRDLFLASGGKTTRTSPHYFILGQSNWFKGLADDMEAIVLPLTALPQEATSVTYPDSFTAMRLAPEYGLPYEYRPYHDQAFRISDIPDLIDTYGLPADEPGDYDGYERRPFERYIEVQLWIDDPVVPYLGRDTRNN
jgi:hypothetical protein